MFRPIYIPAIAYEMKIRELLLDKLSNSTLFEMAYERRKAKDTVTDLSPQIFDHLLKLFVFESPDTVNHWTQEINSFLNKINRIYLKPNKTKPDAVTLYTWIVDDSAPYYSVEYIKNTVDILTAQKYNAVKVRDYDPEWVLNKILSIMQLACKDIALNKFRTITDYRLLRVSTCVSGFVI